MSKMEVKVVRIKKKANHPNADRLTIYNVGGYNCISNKLEDGSDRYNVGDLVVYIPENALLPEWLLKAMGFWNEEKQQGTMAGSAGNRVKPVKLRGIYSEGVLYPAKTIEGLSESVIESYGYNEDTRLIFNEQGGYVGFKPAIEGEDVSEFLGITKWEPPIPVGMAGEMFNSGKMRPSYDIEPIQKYMNVFIEGEIVEYTEKCHGTQTAIVFCKDETHPEAFGEDKNIFLFSKGLGDKGLSVKNVERNANNAYLRAFKECDIEAKVKSSYLWNKESTRKLVVFGETYGVQDLKYGLANGQVDFILFDVWVEEDFQGDITQRYLNFENCKLFAEDAKIKRVPSLYVGPFSVETLQEYTSGNTAIADVKQIREGVVVRPQMERYHEEIGRVILKSVSEAYKLRKGEVTEFN